MRILTTLLLLIVLVVVVGGGVIALQIFLSKKETKWAGLVLPLITFLISLSAVLGIAAFTRSTTGQTVVIMEDGTETQQTQPGEEISPARETGALLATIAYVLLVYNIPTAVLLAIYAACRGKRKTLKSLDKMTVQDLE